MAIDPKLVSIKQASDLPSAIPTNAGEFLFFEDDTLQKSPMSDIYDRVASGIKGIATQANAPTAYTAETYPDGLFERYVVTAPLTSPNSWGNIAVTQAELDSDLVFFNVKNGEVTKTSTPTASGKYIGAITTSSTFPTNGNIYGFASAGTYTNAGGMVVAANNLGILSRVGGVWSKTEIPLNVILKTDFNPTNNTDGAVMSAVNTWFSTIATTGESPTLHPQSLFGYWNSGAVYTALSGYMSTPLISLDDVVRIRLEDFNPAGTDYSIRFFNASNTQLVDYKQKGSFDIPIPVTATKFSVTTPRLASSYRILTFKLVEGEFDKGTSSNVVNDVNKYMPVNSVAVERYVGEQITPLIPKTLYDNKIIDISISIDDFTGTDDEKITKGLDMIENVGGGTLYFPNRVVNITQAIIFFSNLKILLDNTQIQMTDGIHDNIFRPKGVTINPLKPKGKQTEAEWTENFSIEGIGMPTVRQSVVPLHVGDMWGWRGISILFARCRNYSMKNIKVIESHMWSVSNEYSENGYFENIEFANTLHPNADGMNFRNGCRNMYVKKLRGITNDNAVATTNLDFTLAEGKNGTTYQILGWDFGDYWGAENIIVEDVQVKTKFGAALILGTSNIVQNITYKDVISTVATSYDWDNVAVCGNSYRSYIYGTSYVAGNVRNINIINSKTSVHEYSLGVYGGEIWDLYAVGIENTKPTKLGDIKNDTTTVIK